MYFMIIKNTRRNYNQKSKVVHKLKIVFMLFVILTVSCCKAGLAFFMWRHIMLEYAEP